MAACTFAARVVIELALLVPSQALIDQSLGPGPGTSETTTRTAAFARMGVAKWNAIMGAPGAFDDTTAPAEGSEQERALEWATRYAWANYRVTFKALPPEIAPGEDPKALLAELAGYQKGAINENSEPFVVEDDDDDGEDYEEVDV